MMVMMGIKGVFLDREGKWGFFERVLFELSLVNEKEVVIERFGEKYFWKRDY